MKETVGKIAVITGGSDGVGLATAIHFAKEGCNIVICGRDKKKNWVRLKASLKICHQKFLL